ncbi:regucalcin-like isoform X2 [Dermacentor andersoni]|uniref:regucalcin-like isoform X2 n=1 Tax=Dermacentor andersoni TaxID=34620 RepID=UPI002416CE73|nr:regucalcin-like isoform X2 [Dermacentor andersoni]
MSVSAASIRRSNLGEGPHWDSASKTLLYVDAPVGDLCRLDVNTRDTSGIHFDGLVTIAIPYKSNPNLNVITLNRELRKFDWTTSQSEVLTEVDSDKPTNKFNDGKCDVTGRLWAGTTGEHKDEHMIDKENGSLFSIDPATLNVTSHVTKVNISNGMTWSPDNRSMFYVDSFTRSVYSFSFDATSGHLSNRQVLVDFNAKEEYKDCGYPDGMTVDTNGKLLRSVLLPVSKTTSCCFGGDNYDELYVTSAWKGLTPDQLRAEPLAGSVFKVTCLGAKGFEAHAFNR